MSEEKPVVLLYQVHFKITASLTKSLSYLSLNLIHESFPEGYEDGTAL